MINKQTLQKINLTIQNILRKKGLINNNKLSYLSKQIKSIKINNRHHPFSFRRPAGWEGRNIIVQAKIQILY